MNNSARQVVVLGGGTAGWLTAAVIAAECGDNGDGVGVMLIESPNIATIGVGEGTWPSLRQTLQGIGLPEAELFAQCDASFKQGTRFVGWAGGDQPDLYYHPFSLPVDYAFTNLAPLWLEHGRQASFSSVVTPQHAVLEANLAPKTIDVPEYAFATNYGYHLDAGAFADVLRRHCTERLGVTHRRAEVIAVVGESGQDIEALQLDSGEEVAGSLFVDCSGHRSVLLGEHFGVTANNVDDILFNNSAVAVQVPYANADATIPSATVSTATTEGWIWDIGLQSRRGLGHVFSSKHTSDEDALSLLQDYIVQDTSLDASVLSNDAYRVLRFQPGYREQFWVRNCVAVGMSAGFIEPLEASAIALVEQSAQLIARQLPANRDIMDVVAKRFNEKMRYHWQRVIEFVKLHYAVSKRRDSAYWCAHADRSGWPESLADKLLLWQQQSPYHQDAPMLDELFPSASYQYVLYGMGFDPVYSKAARPAPRAKKALQEAAATSRKLTAALPDNRSLIRQLLRS